MVFLVCCFDDRTLEGRLDLIRAQLRTL